ncbi:hypothetical protein BKA58DRAFT_365138 [Alternaria rosae]|uniref:uncharacterized protein n=1 Tax=Alternaria rosae TaxID=1187941 RepID=UPI001E8DCCEE|nr:uncharacterized protein BKA58DRAFT_365138 [Alternaria rosae]KAH6865391.1 hypothetical protein BKA58DRAFT_365138 [Alternaria rosae]
MSEDGNKRKQRWTLRRLLERGVIPLRIQDGGVSTSVTRTWGVTSPFPWLVLPRWRQTKERGFFEFLIPHPERVQVKRLIRLLSRNKMNYRVECRMVESSVLHRECHSPIEPLPSFPLSVGADSNCEALLPFLSDGEVESAHGTRIAWLDDYVKEDSAGRPRAPLLRWSSWAVVRVEAAHWGYGELDCYVLGAVQDSGMEVAWVGDVCERKAVEEIERCGLEL